MSIIQKAGEGIDKFLGVFSPKRELERTKARVVTGSAKRYYDAATKGRRADGWRAIDAGPKEGLQGLVDLRNRSRDFVRNNGYARKAVGGIVSNVVGHGIDITFHGNAKRKVERNEAVFKKWASSTACDFDGLLTFGGIQALAFRTMVESGECFIRRRVLTSEEARGNIPLQLQILEPEFIDHSKDTDRLALNNGNQIIAGIEFDADGRRVAYHIYRQHPTLSPSGKTESVRVEAKNVIHLVRGDRPGQIRGIPWGASVMLPLRDLDLFEDAELVRKKVSAAFTGYITMSDDAENSGTPLDPEGNPILPPLVDRMEPGAIEYLGPGESVTFTTPPNVTGYSEYVTSMLHKVACGYEVPYFLLTGDFSQMNFSSGRMGYLEFQRLIEQWRWTLFIPRCLDVCLEWFKEVAELRGVSFSDITHEWTPPKAQMIDPLKEIQAQVLAVKSGFISPQEAIKELGYDPDTNLLQFKEWNDALDKAGIVLDSDPRADPKRQTAQNVLEAAKLKSASVATEPEVA